LSRTVDLFIDSDLPLERVAVRLGDLVGRPLVASPDGSRYSLSHAGVLAYLSEHDFLDDDDLPLSDFRFVLSAVISGCTPIEDSPQLACLRFVNGELRRDGGLPSLLVLDLEKPDVSEAANL
jgi:hypothetical protein